MVDPQAVRAAWRGLGQQLATKRKAAKLSQHDLAARTSYSRSSIANIETGLQHVNRTFWEVADAQLAASGDLLHGYDAAEALQRASRRSLTVSDDRAVLRAAPTESDSVVVNLKSPLPDELRTAVLNGGVTSAEGRTTTPEQLREAVLQAHLSYQRAECNRAAALVPALMNGVFPRRVGPGDIDRRRLATTVALAHLAVSKLALKFGDAQLAWVAGDRARAWAGEAESAASSSVAQVAIGSALLALPGREHDAAVVVEGALHAAEQPGRRGPAEISALGALRLLAAVVAARLDDHAAAQGHLQAADGLAHELGQDRNELWTAFGPTNVLIHRVSVAARHDPKKAIELGNRVDTTCLHPALASRRSQVHFELAFAFAEQAGSDAAAVLNLLQVEQLAPELLQVHPPAQALISRLLARERRAATPGLRALADRTGMAA